MQRFTRIRYAFASPYLISLRKKKLLTKIQFGWLAEYTSRKTVLLLAIQVYTIGNILWYTYYTRLDFYAAMLIATI